METSRDYDVVKVSDDWTFVAMVLDRLFLIIFSVLNVGTMFIILEAPSLYDYSKAMNITVPNKPLGQANLFGSVLFVALVVSHFCVLVGPYWLPSRSAMVCTRSNKGYHDSAAEFNPERTSDLAAGSRSVPNPNTFDGYASASDLCRRFYLVIYDKLASHVPFEYHGPSCPRFPAHIRNLLPQKQRIFDNAVNPLIVVRYKKVCRDINCHLKKFWDHYERRLAPQSPAKHLYGYIRNKMKGDPRLPVVVDVNGCKHFTDEGRSKPVVVTNT
ncbi:unnamed protein product [Haemonchus placei]|uniref:Protein S-acyltransferase n=1 Tax=Haemonchus placei TaxID=6290 RepID=A0A0N4WXQ9_HAEPC|nr:unnamed protein product [Haemonchus placei]